MAQLTPTLPPPAEGGEGVETATIGFFSWLGITYSIKVFWAPIVDRLKLPVLDRLFGKRRSWILLAQAGIATGLYLMATVDAVSATQTRMSVPS